MKRFSSSCCLHAQSRSLLGIRSTKTLTSSFSLNVFNSGSYRGYAEAATATATAGVPDQTKAATIAKIQQLKEKKQRKVYPPVFYKEDTEQKRVDKAKELLANYKPEDRKGYIGINENYLANILEICASLDTHPEKQALVDKTVELLEQRRDSKCVGLIPMTRAIKHLGDLKRLPDALKMLDIILHRKMAPNTTTAHTLIRAYGQNGALDKAWEVFNQMKSKPFQKRSSGTVAFLAEALIRNDKWDEAFKLIRNMESEYKIKPTFRPYRRFLLHCLAHKEKNRGLAALEDAKAKGITNDYMRWAYDQLTDRNFGKS